MVVKHKIQTFLIQNFYPISVIQYGFVIFFLVSLPLAPLLALVFNIFEMRLDAVQLLKRRRRLVPKMVNGIGIWEDVITVMTVFGTVSNVTIFFY